MATDNNVQQLNRELAHKINEEAMRDAASPYTGKFVGLANGKLVVVSDDLDSTVQQLRQSQLDPQATLVFEAGIDYDVPIDIWNA